MRTVILSILQLIPFFTRIPLPMKFSEPLLCRGLPYLPLIGLIIGAVQALFLAGIASLNLPELAAFTAVTVSVLITGALHLDGLADTADGFFSYRSKEKMLEIMKDPRIGTNGVTALILVLGAKFVLLISLQEAVFALITAGIFSRMNIVLLAALSVPARPDGMGTAVITETTIPKALLSLILSLITALLIFPHKGAELIVISALCIVVSVLMFSTAQKKIAGVTGDVLGAHAELSEILILTSCITMEFLK